MSDDIERRLREALAAKAEQVTPDHLDRTKQRDTLMALQRKPSAVGRGRWLAGAGAAAVSAGVIGAVALSGGFSGPATHSSIAGGSPMLRSAPATPGTEGSASSSATASMSPMNPSLATPGAVATMSSDLRLTPTLTVTGTKATVKVTIQGTGYGTDAAQANQFVWVISTPNRPATSPAMDCPTGATLKGYPVDRTTTIGTIDLPAGQTPVTVRAFQCGPTPMLNTAMWNGTATVK